MDRLSNGHVIFFVIFRLTGTKNEFTDNNTDTHISDCEHVCKWNRYYNDNSLKRLKLHRNSVNNQIKMTAKT